MQVLYVTNFEVESAESTAELSEALCFQHLGAWIGQPADSAVSAEELSTKGFRELVATHGSRRRFAEWERVGVGSVWATRLERRDIKEDTAEFVTRVTVGRNELGTTVRVSMARDLPSGGLTPTAPPIIIQPRIVSDLAAEPRLVVRANGQIQDGRFIQVRTPAEVDLLANALTSSARLPILLVHARTLAAQSSVLRAAQRLIGLMRVVTLDYHAARLLASAVPGISVPYAGGLLVWPELTTPPAPLDSSLINGLDHDLLRQYLMARVAPLSVLTGGVDVAYREARRALQQADAQTARDRASEALRSGSLREQLDAVEAERDRANEKAEYYEGEWFTAQKLADDYGLEIARMQGQVEQLTLSLSYTKSIEVEPPAPDFENCPADLVGGDVDILEDILEHLERASNGHIVFTPNASSSWGKADSYPTPVEMRSCLVKLARMATALYSGDELSIGHLDTWARETFDLRVSLQDDGLQKKLRNFTFDGAVYDRTPHVKVNDGVPPWACGRIHFALDRTNSRVVVDHVGLHL